MNLASSAPDRPRRILIVDDDHDGREVMEIILTYDGFVTTSASSGEEALAALAQQLPDLILLDVRMPDMDGYDVAAKIKGNPATRDIHIIMMSGLSERDAKGLCLKAGAADFLAKPMDRAEVVSRVRNVLRLTAPTVESAEGGSRILKARQNQAFSSRIRRLAIRASRR